MEMVWNRLRALATLTRILWSRGDFFTGFPEHLHSQKLWQALSAVSQIGQA